MAARSYWIYAAFAFVSLAYYLYTPMPENAVEPWKYSIIRSLIKLSTDISWLGELVGYDSAVNITRMLVDITQNIPDDESLKITDTHFDGIPVRIYRPVPADNKSPGLIYIHGGGWTLFSIDNYDPFVRRFAKTANMTMVSIGYRLAPEHKFPIPLEDCLRAVSYFLVKAEKYGVDPEKISISGDSAGGNLAMAVALKLTAVTYNTLPKLKSQILIYPALQAFDFSLPSYKQYYYESGPFIISAQTMVKYWLYYGYGDLSYFDTFISNKHTEALKKSIYAKRVSKTLLTSASLSPEESTDTMIDEKELSNEISELILNPYFAPLMASDEELRKLPSTLIVNAEYDILKDDGWILYHRFQQVHHDVSILTCDGVQHGFLVFPLFELKSVPETTDSMSTWLKSVLSTEK